MSSNGGCGCGGLAPDRDELLARLAERGEEKITVKYVGAPRLNLRGTLTRRSYGKADKNQIVTVLLVDYMHKPNRFQEVS